MVKQASPHATKVSVDAPLIIDGLGGLRARIGSELGVSNWRTVLQDDIITFARLTGDDQWIHVDSDQAAAGPFGTTVQHGFFTLGTATGLLWEVCTIHGFPLILNYGLNKVRFPAPLKSGSRYRMRVRLVELEELQGATGTVAEAVYRLTFEVDGEQKPCCVADLVFRYYP